MVGIDNKDKSIVGILIALLAVDGAYFATPLYNEDHGRAPLYSMFYNTGAVAVFGVVIIAVAIVLAVSTWQFNKSVRAYHWFMYSMFGTFLACCYMLVSLILAPSPPGSVIIFTRYTLHMVPIALSAIYWLWARVYVKRPPG